MSALTEALVAAQAELPTAIGRDSQGVGYRYTSLDALISETRPILNKHGLTITQWPSYVATAEGLRPTLMTVIHHVSGESHNERIPLYVNDKNTQGLGAAITYARREPGFVCSLCEDTPRGWRREFEVESEPLEERAREVDGRWERWA